MKRKIQQSKVTHSSRPSVVWDNPPPYTAKTVIIVFSITVVLMISGRNIEIDRLALLIIEAGGNLLGLNVESQVINGTDRLLRTMFPPQFSETIEVSRIENFNRNDLSAFSKIVSETETVFNLNPITLELEQETITREVKYNPIGYIIHVFDKMIETIEMAIWATIFATLISVPLAYMSAANYSPNRFVYILARATVSFLRAVPELVSAMLLVLAFGFGPIAGILALGFHAAGFLGKFYAEDIENADKGPQEALESVGVSKVKILRFSVLPNVLPQYVAYNMYILDRNIRMATVVGIVGAGGIGQELKGRYDMFDYSHVTTILLVIFLAVFILDRISSYIRAKLI